MKTTYKSCEIEVTREKCLGGWEQVNFSVFDTLDNGYEVASGYSDSEDTVRSFIKDMKHLVDDYRDNPKDFHEWDSVN